jgi:hypothetical protein
MGSFELAEDDEYITRKTYLDPDSTEKSQISLCKLIRVMSMGRYLYTSAA